MRENPLGAVVGGALGTTVAEFTATQLAGFIVWAIIGAFVGWAVHLLLNLFFKKRFETFLIIITKTKKTKPNGNPTRDMGSRDSEESL